MATISVAQAVTAWPAYTAGKGAALNKRDAATRLGLKLSGVEAAIRRTRQNTARIPFPAEDGYAIDPTNGKRVMVPFWYLRTLIPYGVAIGTLDRKGKLIVVEDTSSAAAA